MEIFTETILNWRITYLQSSDIYCFNSFNCTLRYVQAGDKFYELRGDKLVSELENKLGVQLGSTVSVKLNHPDGTPRLCPAG